MSADQVAEREAGPRRRLVRAVVVLAGIVLGLLTAAGGLWWMCAHDEAIAFLPARAGAEWIVFPRRAEAIIYDTISVTVEFQHSFTIPTQPAAATLRACAFKGAAVAINGREVSGPFTTRRNWKLPTSAEVAGLLRPGTNVIRQSGWNFRRPGAVRRSYSILRGCIESPTQPGGSLE